MGSQVPEEVVAWLKANAIPLAAVEPGSPFHDLAPLRPMLSRARIVSLGESTHGTREFVKLKHRLIEYCVSELGFATIAFEANYGSMLAMRRASAPARSSCSRSGPKAKTPKRS